MTAKLTKIGQFYTAPGVSDEVDTIFLGTNPQPIQETAECQEATEVDMRILSAPFGVLYDQMCQSEMPVAAQTLAAMSMAAMHL